MDLEKIANTVEKIVVVGIVYLSFFPAFVAATFLASGINNTGHGYAVVYHGTLHWVALSVSVACVSVAILTYQFVVREKPFKEGSRFAIFGIILGLAVACFFVCLKLFTPYIYVSIGVALYVVWCGMRNSSRGNTE